MNYIHIRNLEKFHPGYKDRKLQWAKIYFTMVQGDPDCEMIDNEIDFARLIKFILLELEAQKPIPLDEGYLTRKGFNLKKRPIALTVLMLHNFIDTVQTKSETCVLDKDKEKEEDKSKSVVTEQRNEQPPHWIQKLIQERMVQVGKLKTQPTLKECLDLESAFPPEKVKEILWAMENYKKLTSNYVSVYLTALKWLKKEGIERKKVPLQKCSYCGESFGNLETHKKSCNKNPANTISKSQATDMLNKLGWEKK